MHKTIGPGLLESAYEECLSYELLESGFSVERQKALPLVYKSVSLDCGYRMDLVVDGKVIVELKAVDQILPVHKAQVLTYLKISGLKVALLVNFNGVILTQNLHRFIV